MAARQAETAAAREAAATGVRAGGEETASDEELFLFVFGTQAEVLRHLRAEAAGIERERIPEILEQWSARQARVIDLLQREAGVADAVRTEPLPPEVRARADAVAAHPLFRKTFQDHPVTFEFVEIDRLVAPQRTVNLTYCRALMERLPAAPTLEDLLALCLDPERPSAPPVQVLEDHRNTYVFSSPSSDLRFLDSAARDVRADDIPYAESGGLPASTVLSFVGYGCASINAFRVGRRLILNNGFHRVYALRSRGVRQIPLVVQEIVDPHRELPPYIFGMPTRYLLHHRRPVLVKDFFEPGLTVTLRVRKRVRAIKVTVMASRTDVLV